MSERRTRSGRYGRFFRGGVFALIRWDSRPDRPVVGGLGNGDYVGGGRVLRGNGNGGFLRGWGLFLRLNLKFS